MFWAALSLVFFFSSFSGNHTLVHFKFLFWRKKNVHWCIRQCEFIHTPCSQTQINCATLHDAVTYLVEKAGGVLVPLLKEEHYEKNLGKILFVFFGKYLRKILFVSQTDILVGMNHQYRKCLQLNERWMTCTIDYKTDLNTSPRQRNVWKALKEWLTNWDELFHCCSFWKSFIFIIKILDMGFRSPWFCLDIGKTFLSINSPNPIPIPITYT